MASEAYTAGLLHNIGQIVLAANLSSEYSAVIEAARKQKRPLREVELEQLGVTYNQVGAYLLGLWGLPLPLLEATALHDTPSSVATVEFSVLTAVHVAHVLAHEETGHDDGLVLPTLDGRYLAALNLPRKPGAWSKMLAAAPPETPAPPRARSTARAEDQPARPFPKLLFAIAVVAITVAVVAVRRNPAPPEQIAPPVAAAEPQKTTEVTEATQTSAGGSPFDSIKVQGIVYRSGHTVAIINGRTLDVGDRVNGTEVVSIEPSTVVLACQGERKIFRLK
jgi:hypothetical protein